MSRRNLLQRADLATARDLMRVAWQVRGGYWLAIKAAERIYGSHGPIISGIGREHFPAPVKDALRLMVAADRGAWTAAFDAKPPRVATRTMRALRDAVCAEDRPHD